MVNGGGPDHLAAKRLTPSTAVMIRGSSYRPSGRADGRGGHRSGAVRGMDSLREDDFGVPVRASAVGS